MNKFRMTLLTTLALAGCPHDAPKPVDPTPPKPDQKVAACAAYAAPEGAASWMSWEDGVDVVGMTAPGMAAPNVIVHVAGMVHTPVGSAPSGLIFYQPDPAGAPVVMGFVSTDPTVGAYFGPHIFAGTPFEKAPALPATITVTPGDGEITAHTEVGGHTFDVRLSDLDTVEEIDRPVGAPMPFTQKGTEARAKVELQVDGNPVELTPAGDPVSAPCGVYVR